MSLSDTRIRISEVTVSPLPFEDEDSYSFTLTVERRGPNSYGIFRGRACWNKIDKTWDYEGLPSGRAADWSVGHRYSKMSDAVAEARKIAPFLTVNGWTVEHAIRMHNGEDLCGGLVVKGIRCSLLKDHEGEHKP